MSTPTTPIGRPNPPEEHSGAVPSGEAVIRQWENELRTAVKTVKRYGYQVVPRSPEVNATVVDQEAPDAHGKPAPIWRTIICSKGGILNPTKSFYPVDEDEYYSIRDKDLGSAIELVKAVAIISKVETTLKHRQRGNAALGGAIVQEVTSEKIVVRCPLLCEAIRSINYWPSAAFHSGSRTLEFNTPYRAIGAHRRQFTQRQAELEKEAENQNQTTRFSGTEEEETLNSAEADQQPDCVVLLDHLKLFLEQVDRVQEDGIRDERDRNDKGMVTFDYLWVLYNPGKLVCAFVDGAMVACCVRLLVWGNGDNLRQRSSEDSYSQVELYLWFLDHDGTTINRRQRNVVIPRFEGAKPISELLVQPKDFIPKEKILEKKERGRRYFNFVTSGFSLCRYKGMLSKAMLDASDREHHSKFTGNVVVDPETYYREHGPSKGMKWLDDAADTRSAALGERMKRFVKVPPSTSEDKLPDDFFFLLADWVRGFTISIRGNRIWAWFHIQDLKKYDFDRELLRSIALPDQDLDDIKALTQRWDVDSETGETMDQSFSLDRIEYKGDGCVILLHGRPGLGKTYTVECIAEYTERPLLRLTCAELGLEPTTLEKTLEKYLKWSERWNAVVLIDEADVFTSKRTPSSSITREAIVSVFLKSLEYYSGIIFFATNRVDNFDAAIIDRVDLIVRFRTLNDSQRRKIRQNCIKQLEHEVTVVLDIEAALEFDRIDTEKYEWNGREIVQVLKLAGRLALSKHYETSTQHRRPKPLITLTNMERAKELIKRHAIYQVSQGNMDVTEDLPTKSDIHKHDRIG